MSTPNFAISNVSKYFVLSDFEDWDTRLENLREIIGEEFKSDEYIVTSEDSSDYNRSYPAQKLCSITFNFKSGRLMEDYGIILYPVIRAGYYQGAVLDWDCEYITQNEQFEFDASGWSEDDLSIKEVVFEELAEKYNEGFSKIHSGGAISRIELKRSEMIEKLEKLYQKICDHLLECLAIMSNGEAIYQERKKDGK